MNKTVLKSDPGYPKVEWNAFAATGKVQGSWDPVESKYYPEDVGYWATKGFYQVIDSLYKLIPGFLWENCSGGGRIKDYGAVRRASKIQNQDRYYPIDARRSFFDASFVFHQLQLATLVGSWADWQASGSVYEFRSASLGAAYWHPDAPNGGNGGPVWSEDQKNNIKKAVNVYKEKIRPLIRNANLEYKLTFEDNTNNAAIMKGSELMNTGISITLNGEYISELMFVERN